VALDTGVLFKVGDGLRLSLFVDGEGILLETLHRPAISIGHQHIDEHCTGVDVQSRSSAGASGWLVCELSGAAIKLIARAIEHKERFK